MSMLFGSSNASLRGVLDIRILFLTRFNWFLSLTLLLNELSGETLRDCFFLLVKSQYLFLQI